MHTVLRNGLTALALIAATLSLTIGAARALPGG